MRSLDVFWKFSPCKVYNKSSGRIITIFASTNEAVCHEVQTDFGSFLRASFIQKLWAHFLNFCVQKWSCLLLSSDAFWKLWLCQVYEESFWRNLTIYASKKRSFLLLSPDAFWKFSACKIYRKGFGRIFTIYVSKNEVVSCEVRTHFGSSLPASFAEKVLGAYSRFSRPKTKLFAVKFRRILEVLCLQVL